MAQTDFASSIASIQEGMNSLLFDLNGRLWELLEYAEQVRAEAEQVLAAGANNVEAELREGLEALLVSLEKASALKTDLARQNLHTMGELVLNLGTQVNAVIQTLLKTKA